MIIKDHFLDGEEIKQMQTPNTSGEFAAGMPDTIVIHFTAGSSAESSAKHLCRERTKASAHLVIGRGANIFQLAPFNIITWHAGRSSWETANGEARTGLNKFSIGIELDNAGELNDNGNGKYLSWFNRFYSEDEVFFGTHRNRNTPSHWHAYSSEQIETTFELCHLLCEHYPITEIVGHEEIAPGRKTDPGPAFPLERLRTELLSEGRQPDLPAEPVVDLAERAIVSASQLNIRNGPGAQFEPAADPLIRGTVVKPVRQQDGWTEVEYTVKGWVSSKYIEDEV